MKNHWIVVSIYQGVFDDVKLFDSEQAAKQYRSKIIKIAENPEDFDVTVCERETEA
jgi:hypothetical protein